MTRDREPTERAWHTGCFSIYIMARRLRALVADDDPDILEMVCGAVEQFGADVTRATNGDELIQRLAEEPRFDVAVIDVAMPWMTGLQAMHSARVAGLQLPVIVMTGLRDPEVAAQAARLGNHTRWLPKPFGTEELYAALRAVLELPEPADRARARPR